MRVFSHVHHHMLSGAAMTHRVAIVGAGPSGFYAADGLLRTRPDLRIDLIDRLPTPFGLVRAGVAPDHQGTKAIVRQFERLLAQPDVRFAGNIEIGRDLSWDELQRGLRRGDRRHRHGDRPQARRAGRGAAVRLGLVAVRRLAERPSRFPPGARPLGGEDGWR